MKEKNKGLLDAIDNYADSAGIFDLQKLQLLIRQHPEHALALQRYAFIQLVSKSADRSEIETEVLD